MGFHFDKKWTLCGSFMIITSPNEKKLEKTATQACIMSKMLANADKKEKNDGKLQGNR